MKKILQLSLFTLLFLSFSHPSFSNPPGGGAPCENDYNVTIESSSLCLNDKTNVILSGSVSSVNYTLRNATNNNLVAGPIVGTGGPIVFNTGPIAHNTTFKVVAEANAPSENSMNLAGIDGAYVTIPNSASITLDTNFTLEAWINRTGVYHNIIETYNSAGGFILRIFNNKARVYMMTSSGSYSIAESTTTIPMNEWVHLAGTFNETTNQLKLYVNGVLNKTSTTNKDQRGGTAPIKLGARGDDLDLQDPHFQDEVRIWDVERTEAEIQASMNACLPSNTPNLVAYYKYDDLNFVGAGMNITDMSGNGNDGTVVGNYSQNDMGSSILACSTGSTCTFQLSQTPSVVISPMPELNLNPIAAACTPDKIDLTDPVHINASSTHINSSTIFSYWMDDNQTQPIYDPTEVNAGTYYINASTDGCATVETVTVNINTSPELQINNPTAVCSPELINLTSPLVTTLLNNPAITVNFTYFHDVNGTQPLANPQAVTHGTYFIQANHQNCFDREAVAAIVHDTPNLMVTNPEPVCHPNTVDITNPIITSGSSNVQTLAYSTHPENYEPVYDPTAVHAGTYYIGAGNNGCLAVAPVVVDVIDIDAQASLVGDLTLQASIPNALYQWVDCDNDNAIIPGANSQIFTATAPGNYAVMISDQGCMQSSDCVNIMASGAKNNYLEKRITIFPNPTTDNLSIQTSDLHIQQIRILDVRGKLIQKMESGLLSLINVEDLTSGIFILELISDQGPIVKRFIKN